MVQALQDGFYGVGTLFGLSNDWTLVVLRSLFGGRSNRHCAPKVYVPSKRGARQRPGSGVN